MQYHSVRSTAFGGRIINPSTPSVQSQLESSPHAVSSVQIIAKRHISQRSFQRKFTRLLERITNVSEDLVWHNRRLYIPNDTALCLRLLKHNHDSKITGH